MTFSYSSIGKINSIILVLDLSQLGCLLLTFCKTPAVDHCQMGKFLCPKDNSIS